MSLVIRSCSVVLIPLIAARVVTALEPRVTKDAVRKAWETRQSRLRTLTIHWREKYDSVWHDPPRGGPKPKDAPAAGAWYALHANSTARFDGEKFDIQTRFEKARRFGALELDRAAFDGKISWSLTISTFPRPFAQAVISSRKHEFGPNAAAYIPLAVAVRPLVPTIARFDFRELRLEPRKSGQTRVNGHVCQMLTHKPARSIERVYLVDPKADFAIRRIESRVNGRLSLQWDIDYSRDRKLGWLPSSWKMAWWSETGKPEARSHSKVTKRDIGKPIPQSEFEISFPAGAKVIDQQKKP